MESKRKAEQEKRDREQAKIDAFRAGKTYRYARRFPGNTLAESGLWHDYIAGEGKAYADNETFKREGYSNAMDVAKEKTARSATRTYHGYPKPDENGVYHGTVAPPGKDKPEQSIDHIFFTDGIRALRYDLDLDQETLDASDHSPVIVDFLIVGGPVLKR